MHFWDPHKYREEAPSMHGMVMLQVLWWWEGGVKVSCDAGRENVRTLWKEMLRRCGQSKRHLHLKTTKSKWSETKQRILTGNDVRINRADSLVPDGCYGNVTAFSPWTVEVPPSALWAILDSHPLVACCLWHCPHVSSIMVQSQNRTFQILPLDRYDQCLIDPTCGSMNTVTFEKTFVAYYML